MWFFYKCGFYPIGKVKADAWWYFSLFQSASSQLFNNDPFMVMHWWSLVIRDGCHQVFKAFYIRFQVVETRLGIGSWGPCWRSCSWDPSGSTRVPGCHCSREKDTVGSVGVPRFVINSQPDLRPFIMARKGFSCSFRALTPIKLSMHHSGIKAVLVLWFLGFAPGVRTTVALRTQTDLHLLSCVLLLISGCSSLTEGVGPPVLS